jgi:hypothetical protein
VINVLSVISHLNFGGAENRLLNLARAIDPDRFRLTVATLYAPDGTSEEDCGSMQWQFAQAGVPVRSLGVSNPVTVRAPRPLKLASTAATLAGCVARLRQLIVATRADVVDAHLETALYTAVPAAVSAGVPAAVTLYSELDLWKERDRETYRQHVFPAIRRFGRASRAPSSPTRRCARRSWPGSSVARRPRCTSCRMGSGSMRRRGRAAKCSRSSAFRPARARRSSVRWRGWCRSRGRRCSSTRRSRSSTRAATSTFSASGMAGSVRRIQRS